MRPRQIAAENSRLVFSSAIRVAKAHLRALVENHGSSTTDRHPKTQENTETL
jgi:hypothetical protein